MHRHPPPGKPGIVTFFKALRRRLAPGAGLLPGKRRRRSRCGGGFRIAARDLVPAVVVKNLSVRHRDEQAAREFRAERDARDLAAVAFARRYRDGFQERVLVRPAGFTLAAVDSELVRL